MLILNLHYWRDTLVESKFGYYTAHLGIRIGTLVTSMSPKISNYTQPTSLEMNA